MPEQVVQTTSSSIDWTSIALIAAIVVPFFSTLATNWFQLRLKRMELFTVRKIEVIENYLKSASWSAHMTGVSENFGQYRSLIFMYAPSELHEKILQLNDLVADTSFDDETLKLLREVSASLGKPI